MTLLHDGRWEFLQVGNDVYRAPLSAPVMPDGIRGGARWFCPMWQWQQFQEKGMYPFQQKELV
jgi:hypothetical protein